MNTEKYYCPKCGAMEVVFEESANPFHTISFVCKKCGEEYTVDEVIRVFNNKMFHPFPSPKNDFDTNDSLIDRIKSKRTTY